MAGQRLRGITFAKQFPNPAEPQRGLFVADQVLCTRHAVEWRVIAPVPYVPRLLSSARRPYVSGDGDLDGIPVARPRYLVLPKRMLYSTVAPAVARAARGAFARAVGELRPQFVHAHALYPSAAAARRLSADAGLPLIVTIHGSDLYTNLEHPEWRAELVAVVSEAAAIVCVGRKLAEDAIAGIGADPARTLVVPDTYDAEGFGIEPRTRDAEREAGEAASSPRRVRLVTVGRLVPEKGHDVLLHALAQLREAGVDAELEIVGGGPRRDALGALARELGVADRVRMLGRQSREGLLDTLRRADLFVLPSLREGFGVALVEAMATGLPVVATRSGGPEEIVRASDGVLVAPGDPAGFAAGIRDAVTRLDSFDAEEIARGIRERYSPEAVGGALVRLYGEVVELGAPRAGTLAGEATP